MGKSRSPCSSPITGRQLDTCYQVICLAAGQNPYTVNPFRPPEESKPAQMWLDSRRGYGRYQTQSQSLGILMRFWVNPSSSFRDVCSAKYGPNLWQIWQVLAPWASPYWANGQRTMTVHNYRPRQFHRTSNGENLSSGYRDIPVGFASLAAARPPTWTMTTIPLQPGGLRGKKLMWTLHAFLWE